MRERLKAVRMGWTHRGVIFSQEHGRVKFFLTVNRYEDGRIGEVFITCDASGSTLDGFCDAWSTAISMLLQHGESVDELVKKFAFAEFEPKGRTECRDIGFARSVPDYVMRWLQGRVGENDRAGFASLADALVGHKTAQDG